MQAVNEMSGKKSSTGEKRKSTSQAKRLHKWNEHFKNLIGNLSDILDKPIKKIDNGQLNFNLGEFKAEDFDVVLKEN